jgi:hypothetical protein
MTRPVITALPPAPTRGEDAATFAAKANTFVAALPAYGTESNALGQFVEEQADIVVAAVPAAEAAISAANYKGEWSTLSGALAIPASVSHNNSVWLLTASVADVTAVEPGVAAVWQNLTAINLSAGVTGTLLVANGGTGLTTLGTTGQVLSVNGAGTSLEYIDASSFAPGMMVYYPADAGLTLIIDGGISGTTSSINQIINGNNLYVYGGVGGVIQTSPDGTVWTSVTSGTTSEIRGLAYGASTYVYGAGNGIIRSSTNGTTWTARTSGTTSAIQKVRFVNNTFIYLGSSGALATSPNGIDWTTRSPGSTADLKDVTYGESLYVHVGQSGILRTSTDTSTWTLRTTPTTSEINAIAYGNGIFVYGGVDGLMGVSNNAINWTAVTSGTTTRISEIVYHNEKFYYADLLGKIGVSSDAINWSVVDYATPFLTLCIKSNTEVFAAGQSGSLKKFAISQPQPALDSSWLKCDGSIVQQSAYPELFSAVGLRGKIANVGNGSALGAGGSNLLGVNYSKDHPPLNDYCAVGVGGFIAKSSEGTGWTISTSNTTSDLYAVASKGSTSVAVGNGGAIVYTTSTNLSVWATNTTSTVNFRAINADGALFVATATNGAVYTSSNGSGTFTLRTSGTSSSINAVTFGNNLYVYAGAGGVLATSTNATTWTARTSGTTSAINALAYGAGLYVYAGNGGVLRTSTDGITWSARTSGTTSAINSLAYRSNRFVYCDSGGAIGYSNDGIAWSRIGTGAVAPAAAVTMKSADQIVAVFNNAESKTTRINFSFAYDPNTEFSLPDQSVFFATEKSDYLYIKATP